MRAADPPVFYLVGTPKGRLTKLEKALVALPWQAVRSGVEVKLLAQEQELYVLAQSRARIDKERAIRRRKLKWLCKRLKDIAATAIDREELLMKLGAARSKARAAYRLLTIDIDPNKAAFSFALDGLAIDQEAEPLLEGERSNSGLLSLLLECFGHAEETEGDEPVVCGMW